ncbi:MAG: glycosyltransferase family 2 protein [Lachnospiraceae bacterium]|nr:glycosyltransferase family 2 protein [Lachnospiraceae bacterium]
MALWKVDVLIPVYCSGDRLKKLLDRLQAQKYPLHRIVLMNTEKAYFPAGLDEKYENVEVHHLKKEDFDHGGTRDAGMRLSDADIVVCMTQDALPADRYLLDRLIQPFADSSVWAAYAHQLPCGNCREVERYTRGFNYPPESRVKSLADLDELGIKTFFCSNVCAAWRRDKYLEFGGFTKRTIFNEDMIFAGRLVQGGGKIAYCADARVYHSHNYSALQQLHRNFDLAVSQVMHPEVFGGLRSESEGIRLVKKSLHYCIQIGKPWLMLQVLTQSAGKFLGYRLGQHYESLPRRVIRWCTMNPTFWEKENG